MSKPDLSKLPRTFATKALLKEIEKGVFELYRDVVIEENGVREKHGESIHISFLREATKDEEPDLTSSRPDGSVLLLKRIKEPDEAETNINQRN